MWIFVIIVVLCNTNFFYIKIPSFKISLHNGQLQKLGLVFVSLDYVFMSSLRSATYIETRQ